MLNLASRDRHAFNDRHASHGRSTILSPTTAFVSVALAGLLPLLWAAPAQAAKSKSKSDLVQATLLADADAAVRGSTFTLGVRLTIKPGWHTYWVNPGEAGQATQIKLTGPASFTFGPVQWPLPTRLEHDGTVTYGYENEVLLMVPVTVAKDAPAAGAGSDAGPAKIAADVTWLSCQNEACVEGSATLSLELPIGPAAKSTNSELFDAWRQRLPAADLTATPAVKGVDQATDGGTPAPTLTVRWAEPPRKVEWFPVATEAVAIGDIAVEHDGKSTTTLRFKPKVYHPDGIPGNRVESLLVYEDAKGVRRGVPVPFAIANPGAEKAK